MAEVDGGRENTGLTVTIFIDRVSHFDGMGVFQDLEIAAGQFAGPGSAFLNPSEPFSSVLQTSSG